MEVELVCEGKKFIFSGDETDGYFKVWRELGFYGGKRDTVPYQLILKEDSVTIDIGGNIGLTAVLTGALSPNGRAFFFEPDPKNFVHLKRVIEANKFARFSPYNWAMGEADGVLRLNQAASSSHAATYEHTGIINVPMRSLDSWAEEAGLVRLDFLKIDVEGYERSVLRGAKKTVAAFKPAALIEFNSLTTIKVGRLLPQDLLEEVFSMFPIVDVVEIETGLPRRLGRSPFEVDQFVGENMLGGFVHDLICYFDEGQVRKPAPEVVAAA